MSVVYLHKVDSPAQAKFVSGTCFTFGKGCNEVYHNGKMVGKLNYVGEPGPGLRFVVDGKSGAEPKDIDEAFEELLVWKKIPVPRSV